MLAEGGFVFFDTDLHARLREERGSDAAARARADHDSIAGGCSVRHAAVTVACLQGRHCFRMAAGGLRLEDKLAQGPHLLAGQAQVL
jgi:hypothetical protein